MYKYTIISSAIYLVVCVYVCKFAVQFSYYFVEYKNP